MNLTPWKRRETMDGGITRLRDEIDRMFERFFEEPFPTSGAGWPRPEGWMPAIDVSESDGEIIVRAETPGVAAKDLDIAVTGNVLTLSGHKEEHMEKKDENHYRCERRFGSFKRMIELPAAADPDQISAESENGVVTIRVAKKPGARPRQIAVKTASTKEPVGT